MAYLMLIFGYKFAKCKKSMSLNFNYLCCAILFLSYHLHVDAAYRPHIIFIMADDLGWNDVSFHGSDQILTPNLDALAYNGIILNNLYTQPVCTPSRAALLTGKYPIHLGMQGSPTLAAEPVGLPLTEKTLADYLKELGYSTKAVGKWHLGYYKREYTPRFRGFDNFYGYYAGFISYYDHILQDVYENIGEFSGYDLRRDEQAVWQEAQSVYATDLFTKEAVNFINDHDPDETPLFLYFAHLAVHAANAGKLLEAPQEEIDKFRHIIDPNRRTYAAMVSKLDESVGQIIEALESKEMLKDSIIVFMSDNGAPSAINGTQPARSYPNWGSNFPFRGAKGTLWEGGVRSPSFIWSASLQQSPRVSTNLMHVSDWLPTLYSAAGGNLADLQPTIDGVDQWLTLSLNLPSRPRTSVLLNIDEKSRNAGIRVENWKLIIGTAQNGNYDGYYGDSWDIFEGYRNTYNSSAVLNSKSGQAMEAIARSLFVSLTNEVDIKTRRQQATITCESSNFWGDTSRISCQISPCLFNIDVDPCERNNVARVYPSITSQLYDILKYYRLSLVPQINQPVDIARANPKLWNNTWSTWLN